MWLVMCSYVSCVVFHVRSASSLVSLVSLPYMNDVCPATCQKSCRLSVSSQQASHLSFIDCFLYGCSFALTFGKAESLVV